MEVVERWIEVARLDALLIEEDALVVGLVEVPADFIGSAGVGGLGVGHEVECAQEDFRSYREYFAGVRQPCLRGSSLNLDPAQLLSDFDLWKLIVSKQVE